MARSDRGYDGFKAGQGTVGATAALLTSPGQASRDRIRIKNTHASQILYVGHSSGVTAANGYPLAAGESQEFPIGTVDIYVIGSGAATTYAVIEIG